MDSDNGNKQPLKEGFEDSPNGDVLFDDPDHIARYRAIGLAEGLQQGTDADVLWAWQWLSDHPEVTNQLETWFQRHVAELKEMGRIN
jgi:hypothetical protein